jgi:hypothetical protein
LIWSAHLIDDAEWVLVQFSGDNGESWVTLTNTSAYTEYLHLAGELRVPDGPGSMESHRDDPAGILGHQRQYIYCAVL